MTTEFDGVTDREPSDHRVQGLPALNTWEEWK